VSSIDGYRVTTTEGKSVGHVAGESEAAIVVECYSQPAGTPSPLEPARGCDLLCRNRSND